MIAMGVLFGFAASSILSRQINHVRRGLGRLNRRSNNPPVPTSLWDKSAVMKPVRVSWLVLSSRTMPKANHYPPGRNKEHPMKILTLSALAIVASCTTASTALAQDVAAGETSFKKCLACHAIGEGAKNKVGPVLNGLDGRHSGSVEGYSYSDANKNSGITWSKDQFLEYIKDPKAKIAGTKMAFAGIKNEKEAGDLWAYISQFDKDGKKK
jgi:cytochrome c